MAIALTDSEIVEVRSILADHFPSAKVVAFGSRVHGKHLKPFSDLDLAIDDGSPITLEAMAALRIAFAESNLPIKVDIVDWLAIDDHFKSIILADGEQL